MHRDSVLAYLGADEDKAYIEEALADRHLVGEIREGGIKAAIDDVVGWSMVPEFLILDITGEEDPVNLLHEFVEKAAEGETNLIVLGDRDGVDLYRSLRQIGVAEYLVKPVSAKTLSEVLATIVRERQDLGFDIDPDRLIVVTGTRGGCGTSTVASALAYAIAERHKKKTLLLDLDLEGGVQHLQFNVDPTMGLIDMFENPNRIDSLFLERTLSRPYQNLGLLSSHSPMANVKVNPKAVQDVIVKSYRGFEYVIVDLPARSIVEKEISLSACMVVVVTPPTLVGVRDAAQMFNFINRHGFMRDSFLVVNKVGELKQGVIRESEFHKRIEKEVFGIPYDPKTVVQSFIRSEPILNMKGASVKAFQKIADRLPTSGVVVQKSVLGRMFGGR